MIPILAKGVENLALWKSVAFEKLVLIDTYHDRLSLVGRVLSFPFTTAKTITTALREYKIKWIYCPMATMLTSHINHLFPGVPVAVVDHDPTPHSGAARFNPMRLLNSFDAYRSAEVIIVHSKRFVTQVQQLYPGKRVEYIPLSRHNMYKNLPAAAPIVSYAPDKINFLFFGVIAQYKGLDVLAKAYRALWERYPGRISLTVIGKGDFSPYAAAYEGFYNFTLINRWIKDEEVSGIYVGENLVTVCPYKDSTQSGVVLVSYEYGAPVIATDSGGMAEQMEDGKTGRLIPPNDADTLCQAMAQYLEDPGLIRVQQGHIKVFLAELEWDKSAEKLVSFLEEESVSQ